MKKLLFFVVTILFFSSCKKYIVERPITNKIVEAIPSVKIGTQVWMTKNLDVVTYQNGDTIPQVTNLDDWYSLCSGAWCYYNNDSITGETYGKLYNWYAVHDSRGLAPKGWHIPNDDEWDLLTNFLGGEDVAGGKIKEAGLSHWIDPNVGATNSSGFNALPAGYNNSPNATFSGIHENSQWWSANEYDLMRASYRFIYNSDSRLNKGSNWVTKTYGFSVRCLHD